MQLRASWLYLFRAELETGLSHSSSWRLGLRKIVDHADIAFSASWWESRSTCREEWSVRPDVNGRVSQKQGSFKKDEQILKKLMEKLRTTKEWTSDVEELAKTAIGEFQKSFLAKRAAVTTSAAAEAVTA